MERLSHSKIDRMIEEHEWDGTCTYCGGIICKRMVGSGSGYDGHVYCYSTKLQLCVDCHQYTSIVPDGTRHSLRQRIVATQSPE